MIAFEDAALDQLFQWEKDDKKIHQKIERLITEEHRLVYQVFSDHTVIVSCKYHYE